MAKSVSQHKRWFGLGCTGLALICAGSAFLALFVGGLLFNQNQTGQVKATIAITSSAQPIPPVTATRLPASTVFGDIVVTIEPCATSSPTNDTVGTATPAPALLGTNAFLLTATFEQGAAMTRAAAYRDGIYATRTAAAQVEADTFAALTATARNRQERK